MEQDTIKVCKNCKTEYNDHDIICKNCKYPLQGERKEQASFIAKQIMHKSDVEDSVRRLKKARIILFIVSAYFFLSPFVSIVLNGLTFTNIISAIISFILGIVFLIFAFLSFKKPRTALLIPLILTSIYYVILLFIAPYDLFWRGIMWKMIIVLGLGWSYYSVRQSDKVLRENKYLASLIGFDKIK